MCGERDTFRAHAPRLLGTPQCSLRKQARARPKAVSVTMESMSWMPIDHDDYQQQLWALPEDQRDLMMGWSPGYVANRLGVSRVAIHQAIGRGKLKAYRIHRDGTHIAIIIPERSVAEYENSETRAKHTPKKYRQA